MKSSAEAGSSTDAPMVRELIGRIPDPSRRRGLRLRSQVCGQRLEIALGVDGRHAARTGRGDRLPIDVILHVARGEHARHAGPRPVGVMM